MTHVPEPEGKRDILPPASISARGGGDRTSPAVRPSAPPLAIAHLMLWTACTAAYLAVQRVWFPELGGQFAGTGLVFVAASALLAGPGLAALLLLPAWRRAGYRFPALPGEWLLLLSGCGIVLSALESLVLGAIGETSAFSTATQPSDDQFFTGFRVSAALHCGVMTFLAVVAWLAFASLKGRIAWRCFFFFLTGLLAFGAVWVPGESFDPRFWLLSWLFLSAVVICLSIALLLAVARDLWKRSGLPWTHWLGVIVFVLEAALGIAALAA